MDPAQLASAKQGIQDATSQFESEGITNNFKLDVVMALQQQARRMLLAVSYDVELIFSHLNCSGAELIGTQNFGALKTAISEVTGAVVILSGAPTITNPCSNVDQQVVRNVQVLPTLTIVLIVVSVAVACLLAFCSYKAFQSYRMHKRHSTVWQGNDAELNFFQLQKNDAVLAI